MIYENKLIFKLKASFKNDPTNFINKLLIALLGIFITLFHIYANSWWGFFSAHIIRITHWTCLTGLVFLKFPLKNRKRLIFINTINWLFFIVTLGTGIYMLFAWQRIVMSGGYYTKIDVLASILLILSILESTRRAVSPFLSITAFIFLLYGLYGHFLPGLFGHRKYALDRVFAFLATTPEAVFGIPIGVSATYIIMFVIFSSFLNKLGAGDFFMDLSFSLTGRYSGGPAKAAVLSSLLFGTISGSSTANVVATGTFTIPLMKRTGYNENFAGAVEAVASTGGQIAPPIMGAAAFIMAEFTRTPYLKVAKVALGPAFLYFFACFMMVHFKAKQLGLEPSNRESLPKFREVIKHKGYLLIPLFTLFGFMIYGYSPMRSVLLSLFTLIILSFIGNDFREVLPSIYKALIQAAINSIPIACACACAGIIMGIINMTGIGVTLSSFITEVVQTNLFMGLVLTAIATIILGCGMPTTAAYIIIAVLTTPALINAGINPLVAHMFVFYYGCAAPITPPVAMSSYAAAAIAQADPMKVSLESVKLGFIVFMVPFVFVYFPEIMLMNELFAAIVALFTASVGVILISSGFAGYFIKKSTWYIRIACIVAGIALFIPGYKTDLIGFVIAAIVLIFQYIFN